MKIRTIPLMTIQLYFNSKRELYIFLMDTFQKRINFIRPCLNFKFSRSGQLNFFFNFKRLSKNEY